MRQKRVVRYAAKFAVGDELAAFAGFRDQQGLRLGGL